MHFNKVILLGIILLFSCSPTKEGTTLKQLDEPNKSWVFWYWHHAAVTKEGITADLEAMKEVGLAGAYLMPISGPENPPLIEPAANQLSPHWWDMIRFAISEAKRLDLEIGLHASDGFALAGGPWITPELSMQKVVWSETHLTGGQVFDDTLTQPETNESYYKDLAIYAFKNKIAPQSSYQSIPKITSNTGANADFLKIKGNKEQFRCVENCWFQYSFNEPFTTQSIQVVTKGNNYQSHRLRVEASDDGEHFEFVYQMKPPRHGWQDTDAQVTYAIPKTTAKHFRFLWTKEGTEPGAEDLDAAKWSPVLKIAGLKLSSQPRIHQFEGKTGEVWRISPRTTTNQLPTEECVADENLLDLTDRLNDQGRLYWEVPEGEWTILRMGHTSTGHTNYTGGGALGLECDKFNPEAINTQFDGWYGHILSELDPELTQEVIKMFHIDSWECGSQNWSPVFRSEFIKRRGYDPLPLLPVMAGVPLNTAEFSEKFLHDVRETITELTIDNFYGIMANRAHEKNMQFSAESVAPTMLSDGIQHHGSVDIPMGEFWLRSPTHDKPNDMLDAVSGAHVYGKQIIQAEGFTELRMTWDEHPGNIKTLLDRNYALGFNRLFFHVYMHNPWMDRAPGMTLGTVGLFFQRDQTWWKQSKAFVEYSERCQKLLQQGQPIVDIAVFTGEGLPRRSILPDRLVETLPGIYGSEKVSDEHIRLKNKGQPTRVIPVTVKHSANMADPEEWLDPLNGYKYDSFNKDALLNLTSVSDNSINLSTGASYQILVLPQSRKMAPNPEYMSEEVLTKLIELVNDGATLLIAEQPQFTPGKNGKDSKIQELSNQLWQGTFEESGTVTTKQLGKGTIVKTPYLAQNFNQLNVSKDFIATEQGSVVNDVAWTHRRDGEKDIYFVSNQTELSRDLKLSLRTTGKKPMIYDPVTDQINEAEEWKINQERTELRVHLYPAQSLFILLEKPTSVSEAATKIESLETSTVSLSNPWTVTFDPKKGGPKEPITMNRLQNWIEIDNPAIKYYSGTATYTTTFKLDKKEGSTTLELNGLHNIATVKVNGKECGIVWTAPFQIDITKALKTGINQLEIEVTNTWRNRLLGDQQLPEEERLTWTTAPDFYLDDLELLPAGLLGPVNVIMQNVD